MTDDLQKLVEQWAKEAGEAYERRYEVVGLASSDFYMGFATEVAQEVVRLAIQYAAEEAAKVCDEHAAAHWEQYARGHNRGSQYLEGKGDGVEGCAAAIREHFKAL